MAEESKIEVWATPRSDRGTFVLRWNDPITSRIRQKTINAPNQKAADKAAGAWEEKLNSPIPVHITTGEIWTWDAFCTEYKKVIAGTSRANQDKWRVVAAEADVVFRADHITAPLLAHINARFVKKLRNSLIVRRGNAPSTVNSGIATFCSGMNYAAGEGWVDPIVIPRERGREEKDDKEMRGRPITGEEFDRITNMIGVDTKPLKHLSVKVVEQLTKTQAHPDTWHQLLNGLWLSGMRISEAMRFHVDRIDCHRPFELDTEKPKAIFVSKQKNRKTQVVAMTKDFGEFLRSVQPDSDGWYFSPTGPQGRYKTSKAVGRVVSALGAAAGVITSSSEFASAHDMRRAFARRWSARVMPPVLQHLMRHGSIDTTMRYYVGSDADAAAVAMYDTWEKRQEPSFATSDEIHESLPSL